MEWVETTGSTIAEALDRALDQLGVDENDAEFEVLIQPKSGFLGRFGGVQARIRTRVKPLSREKPGERRRRGKREQSGSPAKRTSGSGRTAAGGGRANSQDAPQSPRRAGNKAEPVAETPTELSESPAIPGDAPATTSKASQSRSRPRRRRAAPIKPEGIPVDQDSEVSVDEQVATAEEFIGGLLSAFGLVATVESTVDEVESILVNVEGSDLGLLVGPKGATLQAIEELVRTVLQRTTNGLGARISVDVAGYRAKRRAALETFTHQLIERVLETGKDQALEPMPPADRKLVHDVVAVVEGVATTSEGEEPRRRVVIRRA